MKKYIMHHINVIITALRILLAVAAIIAVLNIGMGLFALIKNDHGVARSFLAQTFKVPDFTINEEVGVAATFGVLYGALLFYLIYGIKHFYRCLVKIKSGKMFYNDQGEDFRKAGASIIIFAKTKYLLYCCIGTVVFFDITMFFKQILPFLGVYLAGKLFYLMAYMAEKGEFIQEENELTI